MLRLSATVMAIEVAYSALTGFVSPILLQSGVRHEQTSLIWAISPSLGLILSPLIGSLSDRCKLSLGRRRPFIIMLAVLEVIGNICLLLIDFRKTEFAFNSRHVKRIWITFNRAVILYSLLRLNFDGK